MKKKVFEIWQAPRVQTKTQIIGNGKDLHRNFALPFDLIFYKKF